MSSPLVVPALKKHTATVIMAHGLGDSGAGWISLAQNWRRRGKFEDVKFIFPNAPTIPITVNMGFKMPGWYDITTFSELSSAQDSPGILRSREYFADLIKTETSTTSIPSSRIILGGFSQGAAMSLFTGLTVPTKLGGIFALSGYLLLAENIKEHMEQSKEANKQTPIFMGHGSDDPLVLHKWGEKTAETIRSLGYQVEFKTYEGLEHSAAIEEVDDLEAFITKALKDEPPASGSSSSSSSKPTDVGHPGL